MASARSAHARTAAGAGRPAGARPSARQAARPRVVRGGAARAGGIRWDRIGRVALLVVLLGILGLYAGPARSYISTLHEAKVRRAELSALQRENARLRAHKAQLQQPAALEREARRMGMVAPGERPFVIENLPKGP
jgi:cell division protein FtsB